MRSVVLSLFCYQNIVTVIVNVVHTPSLHHRLSTYVHQWIMKLTVYTRTAIVVRRHSSRSMVDCLLSYIVYHHSTDGAT